jgi:hypothetical protein
MKRSMIAVAALSLALPFAASARPVASFNDHPEHYAPVVAAQGSSGGKAARVLPSFNDHPELFAVTQGESRVSYSGGPLVAWPEFKYPAY